MSPEIEGYVRRRYEDLAVCIHFDIANDRGLYNYYSPWLNYMMEKHCLPDHVRKKNTLVVTDSAGRHIGCSGASQNTLNYYNPLGFHVEDIIYKGAVVNKEMKSKAAFVKNKKSKPNRKTLSDVPIQSTKVSAEAGGHESDMKSNNLESRDSSTDNFFSCPSESNSHSNDEHTKVRLSSNSDPIRDYSGSMPVRHATVADPIPREVIEPQAVGEIHTVPVVKVPHTTGAIGHGTDPESEAVNTHTLDSSGSDNEIENAKHTCDDLNRCRGKQCAINETEVDGQKVVNNITGISTDNASGAKGRNNKMGDDELIKNISQTEESKRSKICTIL